MMNNYGYILTKPYIFEYVNSNIEPPQDKYIQVKYLYCSICGGDYSQFIGRRANYPISLGHEFIGKIVAVGNKVNGFKVGDYVISDFNYRCNNCFFCKNHQSHLCDKNDIQLFTNRGFFQFANIDIEYFGATEPCWSLLRATLSVFRSHLFRYESHLIIKLNNRKHLL